MAQVSVMMPCFNAASTLPWALASLRAQSLRDWECVCVDDGSRDATWSLLQAAAAEDRRFRVHRFEKNKGRGAARQRCLELAVGEFLSFLDADDWLFPSKLESQVAWMEFLPGISVVSPGAAVTDAGNAIVGVVRRGLAPGTSVAVRAYERPHPPQMVFPACMVRMDLAKRASFDPSMRRSQDSDFLVRVALGTRYAVSSDLTYAYSQAVAASLDKTLEGYSFRMRSHLKHFDRHPLAVARTVLATGSKMAAYRAASWFGLEGRLIERRWSPPETEDVVGFEQARALVASQVEKDGALWNP